MEKQKMPPSPPPRVVKDPGGGSGAGCGWILFCLTMAVIIVGMVRASW